MWIHGNSVFFFFFQAEDGIRDYKVTGVQTCALPISLAMAMVLALTVALALALALAFAFALLLALASAQIGRASCRERV